MMPTLVLTCATFRPIPTFSRHNTQCTSPVKEGCRHKTQCIYTLKVGFISSKDAFSFGQCRRRPTCSKGKALASCESGGGDTVDEWIERLPDKKEPLYSHSLPCIEAWLRSLGFFQSKEDRAVWHIEKPDWRAQLSLDITDLYIRYQTSGPGNLERVERKFSYALSRDDLENAILGGP